MPKVSVIIPAYNASKYICEAVDSVIAQTYQDFEIIVVDDGSTDNTREILKKYDGKIRYFFQENRGVSAARNKALREAVGEYIAFLDADDVWLPDKLRQEVDFLDGHQDHGLVCADAYIFDHAKTLKKTMFEISGFWAGDVVEPLMTKNFIPLLTVMVRKKCFDEIGYFDESLKYCEDHDRWLRIARRSHIGCINTPLARYHIHASNASHNIKRAYVDRIKVIRNFYASLESFSLKLAVSKNIRLGKCYFGLGRELFWERRRWEALKYFLLSLITFPFNSLNLLYLATALVPYSLLFLYKDKKRRLRGGDRILSPAEKMFL